MKGFTFCCRDCCGCCPGYRRIRPGCYLPSWIRSSICFADNLVLPSGSCSFCYSSDCSCPCFPYYFHFLPYCSYYPCCPFGSSDSYLTSGSSDCSCFRIPGCSFPSDCSSFGSGSSYYSAFPSDCSSCCPSPCCHPFGCCCHSYPS